MSGGELQVHLIHLLLLSNNPCPRSKVRSPNSHLGEAALTNEKARNCNWIKRDKLHCTLLLPLGASTVAFLPCSEPVGVPSAPTVGEAHALGAIKVEAGEVSKTIARIPAYFSKKEGGNLHFCIFVLCLVPWQKTLSWRLRGPPRFHLPPYPERNH